MKRFAPPVILLLIGLTLIAIQYAPSSVIPPIIPQPVTAAVIVEETADAPRLSKEVLAVMRSYGPKHGVKVFDQNQTDKDKKTPEALVPYFDAAKGKPLPQLVVRRGKPPGETYTAAPCPNSEAALVEAIK